MKEFLRGAKTLLGDITLFSQYVIGVPLWPYQQRPLRIIAESVLRGEGETFLLVFPRQSGKNEVVAHLFVYLLNILHQKEGQMVFGAVGDGLGRGISRLEARLDNSWNRERWRPKKGPTRRMLGKAAVTFLSTHPYAAARGETANWLLVIDELQEQDPLHLEAVFEPMRAANNATALYLGTVKTTTDALWRKKNALEALTAQDGRQRVFIVSPEEVSAANESYGRFLQSKVAQFGRHHPVVKSEYYNEPIDGDGGLFDGRRMALMQGTHRHQRRPGRDQFGQRDSAVYIATLDVAGQDEGATDLLAALDNPGRDYTVGHIFELVAGSDNKPEPTYRAVDVFVDQGGRHFQDVEGRPQLAERLLSWLQQWQVSHLVADSSGVGAGLVDWLAARLGRERVTGHLFTQSSKAALGAKFLAVVETGRFRYWASEYEGDEAAKFFDEVAACRYSLAPGGRFERDLRWGVWAGGHDDRLISAALVAVYDGLVRDGRLVMGEAASAVIHPNDPLDSLGY